MGAAGHKNREQHRHSLNRSTPGIAENESAGLLPSLCGSRSESSALSMPTGIPPMQMCFDRYFETVNG